MKDIMIRMIGTQINRNDEADEDAVEFITEGKAYKKGSTMYIMYEETDMSGLEGVKTTLRIDGEKGGVRMKRFGSDLTSGTVMDFQKGKRFNSIYDTPFGAFEMEVLTNKIINDIEPDNCTGNLFIDYEVALKGLSESRSLLNIEVTEPGDGDMEIGRIGMTGNGAI